MKYQTLFSLKNKKDILEYRLLPIVIGGLTVFFFLSGDSKRVIGRQCRPRSDAANAASDQGLHCLH